VASPALNAAAPAELGPAAPAVVSATRASTGGLID